MTKDEIIARAKKFQGANREFSQELPPIIEAILDNAGPEVVDNLSSNSRTKALSANMGKELKLMVDAKVAAPTTAGTAGQVLSVGEEGSPEWVDAAVGGTYDGEMSDESTNAVQNKVVKKAIEDAAENKANIDGYYPQLVAGLSENLVDTKGTGSEQVFTDRTSCGEESIADDGTGVIKELRGNSLAWNQLFNGAAVSRTIAGIPISITNGHLVGSGEASAATAVSLLSDADSVALVVGHKYYVHYSGVHSGCTLRFYTGASYPITNLTQSVIVTADGTSKVNFVLAPSAVGGAVSLDCYLFFLDLTQMFGAGNEPSTVAEFEALYPELYYPQNAGAIINNAADTLVTDGFNQWDEEWDVGSLDSYGNNYASTTRMRSKNYIPCFPGVEYYIKASERCDIHFYDANKAHIDGYIQKNNNTFTTPANAAFMRFCGSVAYGPTYHYDICINISWSGYRDGEYEPYWKRETGVDMRKIYGKLDGAGEMVQVFPAGGRSAGSIFDVADLVRKEADVRIGSVDFGTLGWAYQAGVVGFLTSSVYSPVKGFAQLICSKYPRSSATSSTGHEDKSVRVSSDKYIIIKDSAFGTDADTFAAAMDGVMLNYELETPLHYTDLMYSEDGGETFIDIPSVYKVADFGTERIRPLVDAQGNPTTAPFRAVIQYNDDFTREIVNLPKNYDTTDSIDDLLSELSSALGTALGGTLTITRGAYNAATKKYAWTVSFAASDSPAENTD